MAKRRVRKASIKQRLRRREGDVKRLEVVLVADSERDQWVAHWMDEHLGRGEASEFTRQALEEKVARIIAGTPEFHELEIDPERLQGVLDALSDAVNELRAELQTERTERYEALERLEAYRDEVHELRLELADARHEIDELRREKSSVPPPTLPEEIPNTVQSSGLDMSRPRPRKPLPRSAPAEPAAPDVLTDDDQVRLAQIMANSIRNAQPGRGG